MLGITSLPFDQECHSSSKSGDYHGDVVVQFPPARPCRQRGERKVQSGENAEVSGEGESELKPKRESEAESKSEVGVVSGCENWYATRPWAVRNRWFSDRRRIVAAFESAVKPKCCATSTPARSSSSENDWMRGE